MACGKAGAAPEFGRGLPFLQNAVCNMASLSFVVVPNVWPSGSWTAYMQGAGRPSAGPRSQGALLQL